MMTLYYHITSFTIIALFGFGLGWGFTQKLIMGWACDWPILKIQFVGRLIIIHRAIITKGQLILL